MNKEETIAAAELMVYAAHGGRIQARHKIHGAMPDSIANWFDIKGLVFNWDDYIYRKKLEPKTIWVNEYGRDLCAHTTREAAVFNCTQITAIREAVKYREVIE